MDRRIVLSALMLIVLVSIIAIVPALQISTEVVTAKEESSRPTLRQRLMSLLEKLPESIKLRLARTASMLTDVGPQTVESQSPEESPVKVGRQELCFFIVDKNFAPVKPSWEVITSPEPVYYVADSAHIIYYYLNKSTGLDLGPVTLTDTWKTGMVWGTGPDVAKPYYLWDWSTNITGAGPWNYDPKTGQLSITFDPEPDFNYYIEFLFLAKTGFVNQFISKPKVSHTLSPKTTPPLQPSTFYDMWLKMKSFKVKGLPLYANVWIEVPNWQSTENGVYIKNMNPQTGSLAYWGANPPDVPGPEWGRGGYGYSNRRYMPHIDPPFPDHWIQFGFQKSDVVPAPNWGNYLYDGEVWMMYANKGFGIVIGDTPQLTLSTDDWDVWATTGLWGDVLSTLVYYFEEPKPTIM